MPDAIIWRAHNLYIACDTELFDKRIKSWESGIKPWVLFLNEKVKNKSKNSAVTLVFLNTSPTAGFLHNFYNTLMFLTRVKARPQHRELVALLFTISVWVL